MEASILAIVINRAAWIEGMHEFKEQELSISLFHSALGLFVGKQARS